MRVINTARRYQMCGTVADRLYYVKDSLIIITMDYGEIQVAKLGTSTCQHRPLATNKEMSTNPKIVSESHKKSI